MTGSLGTSREKRRLPRLFSGAPRRKQWLGWALAGRGSCCFWGPRQRNWRLCDLTQFLLCSSVVAGWLTSRALRVVACFGSYRKEPVPFRALGRKTKGSSFLIILPSRAAVGGDRFAAAVCDWLVFFDYFSKYDGQSPAERQSPAQAEARR